MGLYDNPDRSRPAERRVTNYPLAAVHMEHILTEDDFQPGSQFLPTRVKDMYDRYALLRRLMDGNLTDFVADPTATSIIVNWFRRIPAIIAYLMTTSGPVDIVSPAATSGIVNGMTYGRMFGVRVGGSYRSPQTPLCALGDNDDMWTWDLEVSPTSDSGRFDQLKVLHVLSQGTGIETTFDVTGDTTWTLGDIVAQETLDADWGYVDNIPSFGKHGTSNLTDMIPLVAAVALRLTGADSVLAANESPTTVIPIELADLSSALAGDESEIGQINNMSRREAEDEIQRLRDYDRVLTTGGTQRGYVLEWTGNLDSSMELIEKLNEALRFITGASAQLLEGGMMQSGAALREQNLLLWAQTLPMHREHKAMWEFLFGGDIDWDNPFDVAEATADTTLTGDDPGETDDA